MTDDQLTAAVEYMRLALKAIDDATAQVQHAVDVLIGNNGGAPDYLGVPWVGQNTTRTDDDYSNSDCGPACVTMWLRSLGKSVVVDDVSKATGLSAGYTYTLPAHLITAAGKYGLSLKRELNITQQTIEAQINLQRPIILLVHYGSMPKRFSSTFKAGHWIIVVGYTASEAIYHDPLAPDVSGEALHISWSDLDKAMADCAIDGNTQRQGLIQVSA